MHELNETQARLLCNLALGLYSTSFNGVTNKPEDMQGIKAMPPPKLRRNPS